MKASESKWSNQRQETRGRSISHMKFLPGKIIHGSDRYLQLSNTEQQTHAVFGELAHYGSEPFILP